MSERRGVTRAEDDEEVLAFEEQTGQPSVLKRFELYTE